MDRFYFKNPLFEEILVPQNVSKMLFFVITFSKGFKLKSCIFINSLKFPVLHDNIFDIICFDCIIVHSPILWAVYTYVTTEIYVCLSNFIFKLLCLFVSYNKQINNLFASSQQTKSSKKITMPFQQGILFRKASKNQKIIFTVTSRGIPFSSSSNNKP